MRIFRVSLSVAGLCLLLLSGCQRKPSAELPSDSFRLTAKKILADDCCRVLVVTVQARRYVGISARASAYRGSGTSVVLGNPGEEKQREGRVILVAMRVAPTGGAKAYLQTIIKAEAEGTIAGGQSLREVPADSKVDDLCSVSSSSGVYKLGTPVTIAQLQGKPVTVVAKRVVER